MARAVRRARRTKTSQKLALWARIVLACAEILNSLAEYLSKISDPPHEAVLGTMVACPRPSLELILSATATEALVENAGARCCRTAIL